MKRRAWLVLREFNQKRSRFLTDLMPIDATDCKESAIAVKAERAAQRPDLKHHVVRVEYEWPR